MSLRPQTCFGIVIIRNITDAGIYFNVRMLSIQHHEFILILLVVTYFVEIGSIVV